MNQVGETCEGRRAQVFDSVVVKVQSFQACGCDKSVCFDSGDVVELEVNDFEVASRRKVWRGHRDVSTVQNFKSFSVRESVENVWWDSVDSRVGYANETDVVVCHSCRVVSDDVNLVVWRIEIVVKSRNKARVSLNVHDTSCFKSASHFKRLPIEPGNQAAQKQNRENTFRPHFEVKRFERILNVKRK